MSERMTLEAQTREPGAKRASRKLVREGMIAGVVYGKNVEPFAVKVAPKALKSVLLTDMGRNNVFGISVDGKEHACMVKDTQFDPIRREITHVDFYVVTEEQSLVLDVPVKTVGRSEGERNGGLLQVVSRTVKIRCAVKNIPTAVEHDITAMDLAEQVYVDELTAPEGCELVFNHRFPVIKVATRRGAKVDEADGEAEATEEAEA
ncbi:MAG: large subunit ribosomal protein L25 [Bradymonadia bacterium]|jgi:large subunit ribosomal protein L25